MHTSPSDILLEGIGISKAYGDKVILDAVDIRIPAKKVVSLLGQSGSGKTTLFNILAGLAAPDTGEVRFRGKDITATPGHIAYMLQKDLLLRHLKIIDNVSLPLRLAGKDKKAARETASAYFSEFGLEGTQTLYPSSLSGGMAQRAAFLRTFLFAKDIVLLDEPFSRLDAITRLKMQDWYLEIRKKYALTTLLITHDIDEALRLSDAVYVLSPRTHDIAYRYEVPAGNREEFLASRGYMDAKNRIQEALLSDEQE
ncbi:ABC-type nitrate/sulfonate/bicarbonate transport system ATPase subunit [Peptoniphilus ivorii]|uniref:ABC transporter ATP-binding protein n=1 Tax=Aedoeadaptatus ivorii TaxID=54006 RepID=UPI002788EEE4|nr:ATP-binding cassette domain-containing protein [Peptoniphilus ivorii]MDQ0507619.1 ABC-type nitrate/sulfonate/bicarbonate transport system ATPase subunit [Peptoniphilus ivorii]